jgi:hypothetical protein
MECRCFHRTIEHTMMTKEHLVVLHTDYAVHWDHMAEVNTTDTGIYNEHHFDPSGFLANFLWT